MSGGGGLRKRPHRSYEVRVPSTTVRDTQVSYRSLGVLTWVLDQADGWDIRSDQMATAGKRSDGTGPRGKPHKREGREAIRTALRELAAAGYYRLERRRMLDGTMTMGTAVSFTPVDSWAEQSCLFGQKAVPVVEQPDGSFWVRYPDGTLQPDDWPAPDQQPGEVPDSTTPWPLDDDAPDGEEGEDVSAGGDPSDPPAPENPSPVPPGPRNPAPGEPASGNTSPLVSTSMSVFHEVGPTSSSVETSLSPDSSDGGGGEAENPPDPLPVPELARLALADALTAAGETRSLHPTRSATLVGMLADRMTAGWTHGQIVTALSEPLVGAKSSFAVMKSRIEGLLSGPAPAIPPPPQRRPHCDTCQNSRHVIAEQAGREVAVTCPDCRVPEEVAR